MAQPLEWINIASHLLLYVVCAVNIWVFYQHRDYYKNTVRLRSLPLIYCGFACFAIATSFDIAEHLIGSWVYSDRLSMLNRIFFSFAVGGVGLIAIGLRRSSRFSTPLILASLALTPFSYGYQGGKIALGFVQAIPTIFFVSHWYVTMRDWKVFIYPILVSGGIASLVIWLDNGGHPVLYVLSWLLRDIAIASLGYVAWINPQRERQA